MDTNKNSYTVIYTIAIVVIVAALLTLVSLGLKPKQQTNIEVEKQQNILEAALLAQDAKTAKDKNKYIQDEFNQNVVEALVINAKGEVIAQDTANLVKSEAFAIEPSVQFDIMRKIEGTKDEAQKEALKEQLRLPVFVCKTPDGQAIVISCYGSGLWGPIWGYIALKEDYSTIYGILFDHKSETPGLGGEIVTEKFRSQFNNKIIVAGGAVTPVKVVKGGAKDPEHEIDALSGATITSTAVQTMIAGWLEYYEPYLLRHAASAPCCKGAESGENTHCDETQTLK